jgi:hypothetical protein
MTPARKRVLLALAILSGLALFAVGFFVFWQLAAQPRLTINGSGGGGSIGGTSTQFVRSEEEGVSLLLWFDSQVGSSRSGTSTGWFTSSADGHVVTADGKLVAWQWDAARPRGGHFQINGTPYELANGTLILVSTKGGQVRVTQVNVDMSRLTPDDRGLTALAQSQPKVAQFLAEATGQRRWRAAGG